MAVKLMKGNRRATVAVSLVNAGGSYVLKISPIGTANDGKEAHSVTVLLSGAEGDALQAGFTGPVDQEALVNALT